MSKLAQAGDSRTVSPGRAREAAPATAASMEPADRHRAVPRERGSDQRCVAADQHGLPHLALAGRAERREVLALALAARDQDERAIEALDRRDRRADVRALRIVDPRDAAPVAHPLGAVRQALEIPEHARHRLAREAADAADRERGERVGRVVSPRQPQRGERQERLAALGQPVFARPFEQPEIGIAATQAEPDRALTRPRHAHDDLVVEIHDRRRRPLEDARLRGRVFREIPVAVEVIGRDVQHGGRLELQRVRGLELVGGQLEHVHRGRRAGEQVERGLAEVAADPRLDPGCPRELADERRDRALAVGARDADDPPARLAREQLDVADEVEASCRSLAQQRLGERHARRHHDLFRALEHRGVETAERSDRVGHEAAQFRESRRLLARVGHDEPMAARGEVPGCRHAGAAEAHDHAMRSGDGLLHQRSFKVASPMRTSMKEMIQKRTITLGSAQPFSS